MEVSGYVVRFCDGRSCSHESDETCPNSYGTKYYINPEDDIRAVGAPLMVAHNERLIVGKCVSQVKTDKSLYLTCEIDDAYFLESLRRRYNDYTDNYNANVTFETFCKKTLSSFSLSHEVKSKRVRHVSLVDTPARKGTAVDYAIDQSIVLKRRAKNQYISDVIASHSAAYLPSADRTNYLLQNTSLSHNPRDVCYINASRKMNYQDQLDEASAIYNILKLRRSQQEGKKEGGCPPLSLKRNQKTEDDGQDNDDNLDCVSKRQKTCVSEAASTTLPITQPMVIEAMRDGVQQGFQAAMELFKAQFAAQQSPPPPPEPEPAAEQPVEASRSRPTITITPDHEALDMIVNHILGKRQ